MLMSVKQRKTSITPKESLKLPEEKNYLHIYTTPEVYVRNGFNVTQSSH